MATATDILATVFQVSGHQRVVTATNSVSNAQIRLSLATNRFAEQVAKGGAASAADQAAQLRMAQNNLATSSMTLATANLAIFGGFIAGAESAIEKLRRFAAEVMNIRDLTGASSGDSVRATNLFRISGMGDTQALRDVMRLGRDAFSSQGQGALAQLGISASAGQSGLQLLDEIADKLQGMQAGLRRTNIETQLFGARGVAAIQPFLRLTKEQRGEIDNLSDSFDTSVLPAVQAFQTQMGIAGQKILQDFVFPIAASLMPVVLTATEFIGKLAHGFTILNSGIKGVGAGWLSATAVFAGSVFAIGKVINGVQLLTSAIRGLAIMEGIQEAISGPGGWATLATGLVIAGAAVAGINAVIDGASGSGQAAASNNTRALDRNTAEMARLGDSFGALVGKGVPSNLTTSDIAYISRRGYQSAIG